MAEFRDVNNETGLLLFALKKLKTLTNGNSVHSEQAKLTSLRVSWKYFRLLSSKLKTITLG